jgi:tetratricopeptide (TPR) repeat protein
MRIPMILRFRALFVGVSLAFVCGLAFPARGAVDIDETRALFLKGKYAETIKTCDQAIADDESSDEWRVLLARALIELGRYTNAYSVVTTNLEAFPWSVKLRLLGHEICRRNGQLDEAAQMLRQIDNLAANRLWAYQDAPNLTAIGHAALLMGIDPKRALEFFFDRARKRDPENRDPYLASGQLALDKGDYQLAAKSFTDGLKKFPNDADFHFGLARAFAPSDRKRMIESLEAALELNTQHTASYLLLAGHFIDGEDYEAANKTLDKALAINPWDPEAWADRAVIAHLLNDAEGETSARAKALKFWDTNPEVDHLIGDKLSQKYRFAEGASRQRQSLAFDTNYLPARLQLAQDELRLGEEQHGWELAHGVHTADAYDVTAYNLVTLHDSIAKFTTLTNRHFIVRMATNEALVYGQAVLSLLDRAHATLGKKYGLELETPVTVEIFPNPKDFGVRTFGMPGNPGYLGVCFGNVITANSPASQGGHPANWNAVLWHEFCHVITLSLTRNKMPRWLSEGISVFEEKQENATWGQEMNPLFREMTLGKDFTPLSDLSAAFLAPKSDQHLQFAYYESSLAVEFLVNRFGIEAIKRILQDLGEGIEINASIAKHTASMDKLEPEFAEFARARAEKLAPGLDFEKPKSRTAAAAAAADEDAPKVGEPAPAQATNFYALTREAKRLLREKKWQEAKVPAEKLRELYPGHIGTDNAMELLAEAHRRLGETNEERTILSDWASRDADALDAYMRLMELNAAKADWAGVATNAERYLAVNPLVHVPYGFLAEADEALGRRAEAIGASRTLVRLDPPDPAGAQFRLARLLHAGRDPGAKRHALIALEEAPRFRDAQKLLLKITQESGGSETNTASPAPAPK